MPHFIDINRLDYVKNSHICMPDEFRKLKQLHEIYRHHAVQFIVRNNLQRKQIPGFTAIRIFFNNTWEWHTPDEIDRIITEIHIHYLASCKKDWDCMWMLKQKIFRQYYKLYADVIFFWHETGQAEALSKWIAESPENYTFQVKLLFQQKKNRHNFVELQKLCLPEKYSTMLQCRFACDIE